MVGDSVFCGVGFGVAWSRLSGFAAFRVWGPGVKGLRVYLNFRVQGCGFRVWGRGLRISFLLSLPLQAVGLSVAFIPFMKPMYELCQLAGILQ